MKAFCNLFSFKIKAFFNFFSIWTMFYPLPLGEIKAFSDISYLNKLKSKRFLTFLLSKSKLFSFELSFTFLTRIRRRTSLTIPIDDSRPKRWNRSDKQGRWEPGKWRLKRCFRIPSPFWRNWRRYWRYWRYWRCKRRYWCYDAIYVVDAISVTDVCNVYDAYDTQVNLIYLYSITICKEKVYMDSLS